MCSEGFTFVCRWAFISLAVCFAGIMRPRIWAMKCFDGLTEALLDVDSLRSCNAFHA